MLGGGGGTLPRRTTSFLVRPRLGGSLRSYLRPRVPHTGIYNSADMGRSTRKPRIRKSTGFHKMDSLKKRTPDYTDIAYREAVARLRYLLAESYSPHSSPAKGSQIHRADDSGDEIESVAFSERSRHQHHHFLPPYRAPIYGSKRALYTDTTKLPHAYSTQNLPSTTQGIGVGASEVADATTKPEGTLPPPELMTFIERQEEYIEQLEKESQYCRDELSALLGKVKEVISENEGLHEREKAGLLKSVFDCFETGDEDDQEMEPEGKTEKQKPQQSKKKRLEGPSIVFESRISELEAQLTQTKMDLRKALEEADLYKKKLADQPSSYDSHGLSVASDCNSHRQLIESLQREKDELNESLIKLQAAITQFREKEAEASLKVKRSLDVVDQAQFEKAQVEKEVTEGNIGVDPTEGITHNVEEKGEDMLSELQSNVQNSGEVQENVKNLYATDKTDVEITHLEVMKAMPLELELSPVAPSSGEKGQELVKPSVSSASVDKDKTKKKKCKAKILPPIRLFKDQELMSKLAENKIKLISLEIKNAKLAEEKLKLEVLIHKARLDYYRKRNTTNTGATKKKQESSVVKAEMKT